MTNNYRTLKQKKDILSIFETFLDELLELCESEIEKQLFLSIIHYLYFEKYVELGGITGLINPSDFEGWMISDIRKNFDRVDIIGLESFEFGELKATGYKQHESELVKLNGICFTDEHDWENTKTEYKLIPQYIIKYKSNYRLDFALLATTYKNSEVVKITKIAIECDGHEFHSKKDDLTRDNQRNRDLQLNDWKVYRFSGSEIYSIDNLKKVKALFKEIRRLTK